MSVRALSWSFALLLPDMAAKAVLHALADHADDAGRCWPSVKRIAQWAGCNEKTARKALQRVVELGAVKREERPGTSDIFHIQFDWTPPKCGTTKTYPSQIREVPKATETPPKNDPDPSLFRESNRQEPSKNHQPLSPKAREDAKPHKLPSDWRPTQACRDFAVDLGLDADATAEAFVDYWTGKGAGTKRTDWDRTWRVWCRRETARPMGQGSARRVQPTRGNDAFYQQLADIAHRPDD